MIMIYLYTTLIKSLIIRFQTLLIKTKTIRYNTRVINMNMLMKGWLEFYWSSSHLKHCAHAFFTHKPFILLMLATKQASFRFIDMVTFTTGPI